ncbi:MAG: penicillin acylase family protein [Dehalococcoidia bacterium]|nr:MAG: penicillin acylase family protein [Dehalococcoidia bacterium]
MAIGRAVRYLVLGLVLGAAAGGAAVYSLLRRSVPCSKGSVRLKGLDSAVEVIRDRWGLPHIYAGSVRDAIFAQGYVHAQDRLWNIELARRAASGSLAEVFGAVALDADRLLRRVGLRRAAEAEVEQLAEAMCENLDAYAAGVNAFVEGNRNRLPPEFLILRFRPEPWTAVDSLTIGKFIGWSLSGNWDTEIVRSWIVERLGPEEAARMEPGYPVGAPLIVPPGGECRGLGAPLLEELRKVQDLAGAKGGGSNNWAVDGHKSVTGKPLLANDPHLPLQMPTVWYEVHLNGGGLNVIGVSLPGVPGVIIGHNDRIAWGITNTMTDGDDLFVEQINPANPRQYDHKGKWVDGDLVREEIRVRGRREPVVEEVLVTRHGPIISPSIAGETRALALRTIVAEPSQQVQALILLNRAGSWEGFREALRQWPAPAQNFVYADVEGNIGYQMAGLVPLRAKGQGLVPSPGWTDEYDWKGFIPFDELPSVLNPPTHYVATANNKIVDDDYPHFLGAEYMEGYRVQRIIELLEARQKHSLEDFRSIQGDIYSIPGYELAQHLLSLKPANEDARRALNFLRVWDCQLSPDSVAATIVEAFFLQMLRNTVAVKLGPLTDYFVGKEVHPAVPDGFYLYRSTSWLLGLMKEAPVDWFGGRDWREVMEQSLEEAVAALRRSLGEDMSRWTWGRLHYAPFEHVLGRVRALRPLFNRGPVPMGGDMNTVAQASYVGSRPYAVGSFAVSYRQIVDLSDFDRSVAILPGGQSGHPASRHYSDMIDAWRRLEYHPLLFDREEIERQAAGKLTLTPA